MRQGEPGSALRSMTGRWGVTGPEERRMSIEMADLSRRFAQAATIHFRIHRELARDVF